MSMLKTSLLAVIPFVAVVAGYQFIQPSSEDVENNKSVITESLIPTPQVLKDLEQLGGFKEDESVSPKNTIYVFYDPTCPSCHILFDASYKNLYQQHGLTIKWIPTTILGDSQESLSAAITGLNINDKNQQAMIFNNQSNNNPITDQGIDKIVENNEYLKAYSKLNAKSVFAVPTVLYMNQNGSNVRVSYNISDDKFLLKVIDGKS